MAKGVVVRSVQQLKKGGEVIAQLTDGQASAVVREILHQAPEAKP